jgi:hypothetical protein
MTMKRLFAKRGLARPAIAASLALAALAGMVAGRERPTLEVVQARTPAASAPAGADLDLAKLGRREASTPQADQFAPRSFAPPQVAQAPAPEAAAAAPGAPPLPFVYIGRVTQGGRTDVYVMRGEELIEVAAGRKIDDEYRVEAISEASISFTYLPLRMRQSLELAEAGG